MPADLRFFGVFTAAADQLAGTGFFTGPEHAAAELTRRMDAIGSVLSAPNSQSHVRLFRVTGAAPWLTATAPDAIPAYTVRLDSEGAPVITRTVLPEARTALPDLPEITVEDDQIVIGPSKIFPFRMLLLTWEDGTPLAEALSIDPTTFAPLGERDHEDLPRLRLYVDDRLMYDVSPQTTAELHSPTGLACGEMPGTAEQAETSTDANNGATE